MNVTGGKNMQITKIPAKPRENRIVRVAAYARVSADKDAAFHSLEAQTEYYQEYVSKHPDWILVGIYSDNGISGTIIDRPEFQRMLEDCRAGEIDFVITKRKVFVLIILEAITIYIDYKLFTETGLVAALSFGFIGTILNYTAAFVDANDASYGSSYSSSSGGEIDGGTLLVIIIVIAPWWYDDVDLIRIVLL